MNRSLRIPVLLLAFLSAGLGAAARAADVPVGVVVDAAHPGAAIGDHFSGVSYEIALLTPDANGQHYFRPDNTALIDVFRSLGIRSLRVGGNTSDRNVRQMPTEPDLDALFGFAKAAGAKVIYCLRLHDGDPAADAATARYIMSHYGALLDSFSIGQEPSAYPVEKVDTRPASERMGGAAEKFPYESYRDKWAQFADVIAAAVPDVSFCGPSVHNNAEWAQRFLADFGRGYHVTLVTEHLYPGGAAGKLPSAEVGRDRMLSDDFVRVYEKLHRGFVPQARALGLRYRLEEVNSYFNGGAEGASNTFAASLWALDFMYWWASHDADGLNFHTGDRVSMNGNFEPPRYAAFVSAPDGFAIRPVAYGMMAFDLGGHGRLVPVKLEPADGLNLTAYGTLAGDDAVFVTVVNKEHGAKARDAALTFAADPARAKVDVMFLAAPDGNVAAMSGLTLGGAPIEKTGRWSGTWQTVTASASGSWQLKVPATSAAIVRLRR